MMDAHADQNLQTGPLQNRLQDPLTLTPPRWFSSIVSVTADAILMVVTLVIIAAMWLPAYLTSSSHGSSLPEASHDDHIGFTHNR